jgi:hypothetical protein
VLLGVWNKPKPIPQATRLTVILKDEESGVKKGHGKQRTCKYCHPYKS